MTPPESLISLDMPEAASDRERRAFRRLGRLLTDLPPSVSSTGLDHASCIKSAQLGDLYAQPYLAAAALVVLDLVDQGWAVEIDKRNILLRPPAPSADRDQEKARIRRQEHVRRDEQLRQPSVRRFITHMEHSHEHRGELVSVFNLMRDGRELADSLLRGGDPSGAIRPYSQIVDDSRCELTGFGLHDIWRYFRHTWANAYSTVPGRSMPILIRDAATPHHAIIGLAAISSPVVQIAERDSWMGWETDQFLLSIAAEPTEKVANWIAGRIHKQIDEIYIADLVRDKVLPPRGKLNTDEATVSRLKADAARYREKHHRASNVRADRNYGDAWTERAESHLFRSKRSAALAEALEIAAYLGQYFERERERERDPLSALRKALDDRKAREQMRRLIRRARGERVGTVVADLTVCGAVPPYNTLAAGKLVGAMAVSPNVLLNYRTKYSRPSEIASSMAGRPIERESRLAFVGTTSLYGAGSSQYNRLFWPASVMGGQSDVKLGFFELGRSKSFGTSHFSDVTVSALIRVSQLDGTLVRVNGIFGEGVSPRLRKVRLGLATLGWPANDLLKHGRERIVYGVPLAANLRDFALGIDKEPEYLLDPDLPDSDDRVAAWWMERWALRRAEQPAVLEAMRSNTLVRPIRHGARVRLPQDEEMLPFHDEGTD